jgi:DNA-binding MarR family transcriptional regulator
VADAGFGYNVLFEVWLVTRATIGLLDAAVAPSGLTADEFGIYSVLCEGDAMTPTELAQRMSAPPSTVTNHVQRFERRGHLERIPNPADRRSYMVRLTPAGQQTHENACTYFAPALSAVVAELGRNEPTARRSLERIKHAVDKVAQQRLDETDTT